MSSIITRGGTRAHDRDGGEGCPVVCAAAGGFGAREAVERVGDRREAHDGAAAGLVPRLLRLLNGAPRRPDVAEIGRRA
jgi:hypothetical protein